jgi:hypothetical protein
LNRPSFKEDEAEGWMVLRNWRWEPLRYATVLVGVATGQVRPPADKPQAYVWDGDDWCRLENGELWSWADLQDEYPQHAWEIKFWGLDR